MPKNEKESQTKVKPQAQNMIDHYAKLYKDVSDEIVHLIEEIKYEIQWLEQHCHETIGKCESDRDLRLLVELRKKLEETRNDLRRESYSLSYTPEYTQYLLGEITQDELGY